jgi:hypothetical protein
METIPILTPAVSDYGPILEARHPSTGNVLVTARRSHLDHDEWIGWWVSGGDMSEVVATKVSARLLLVEFATHLLADALRDCPAGGAYGAHSLAWREGADDCDMCGRASWMSALTGSSTRIEVSA